MKLSHPIRADRRHAGDVLEAAKLGTEGETGWQGAPPSSPVTLSVARCCAAGCALEGARMAQALGSFSLSLSEVLGERRGPSKRVVTQKRVWTGIMYKLYDVHTCRDRGGRSFLVVNTFGILLQPLAHSDSVHLIKMKSNRLILSLPGLKSLGLGHVKLMRKIPTDGY
ncbi:hypothetical protein LZ31DRAFT_181015 [Colletotrichum somersetense]|nr:hypothetical protein LZ31DRAFT_181015 [Colletotrichum somersetense]